MCLRTEALLFCANDVGRWLVIGEFLVVAQAAPNRVFFFSSARRL